jgi:Mg2+ and Co2+ transporter CorA
VRWINITGEKASHIMKMTALRFRLHPLALEDALDCENQRPKAESYSSHYFIMVPLFYLEYEDEVMVGFDGQVSKRRNISAAWRRWRRRSKQSGIAARVKGKTESMPAQENKRVSGIGFQMTSIFVTMPTGKTVITFNKQDGGKMLKFRSTAATVHP